MSEVRICKMKSERGGCKEEYLHSCSECPLYMHPVGGRRSCTAGVSLDAKCKEGFPEGCPLPKLKMPALGPCPVCGMEGKIRIGHRGSVFDSAISAYCEGCGYGHNYVGYHLDDCVNDWKKDYAKAEKIRRETGASVGEGCDTCEYLTQVYGSAHCNMASCCCLPGIKICDLYVKKGEKELKGKDDYGCLPCPLCGSRDLGHVFDEGGYEIADIYCKECKFKTGIHFWNKLTRETKEEKE